MNIDTEIINFIIRSVLPILVFIFAIIKYFVRVSSKQRKQKSKDYKYQMRAIGGNKKRIAKKRYQQLEREMNFQVAYDIDLSDEAINNIFRSDRPKVILDNIKLAGGKLEMSDDNIGIIHRSYYKFEVVMNYTFGYVGLVVIALGGLVLHFQDDWVGFVLFLLFITGGFALVIPAARDLARYRAAKKVIEVYTKTLQKKASMINI